MELIYGFDPLCMWSYAFVPNLKQFVKNHEQELITSVVCSGMIRGDLVSPMVNFTNRLEENAKRIENFAGIDFGPRFYQNLKSKDIILDSVPGSIAVNAMKMSQKHLALDLAMDLSSRIYYDGISPGSVEAIADIMLQYDVPLEESMDILTSDQGKYLAYQDFQWFEAASLSSTPVLILDIGGELVQLTKGYTSLEKLESVYAKVIKEYNYILN